MKTILLFLGAIAGAFSSSAHAADAKRPNILFIFSDDHAYQAISAYGDPRKLIETPNIDRIAKEGMRLDRWSTARACLRAIRAASCP